MTWKVFELEKQWLGLKKHLHQILPLGNMLIKNVCCHLFEWGSNVIAWCYLIWLKGFMLLTLGEIVAVLYWMSTKCRAFPFLLFPGFSQWESGSWYDTYLLVVGPPCNSGLADFDGCILSFAPSWVILKFSKSEHRQEPIFQKTIYGHLLPILIRAVLNFLLRF